MDTLRKVFQLVLFPLALLMAKEASSQSRDQLIRYDENAFVTATDNVNADDYVNKQKYALMVFRSYYEQKGVAAGFTEDDYKNVLKEKAAMAKMVEDLQRDMDRISSENLELKSQIQAKTNKEKELRDREKEIVELRKTTTTLELLIDNRESEIRHLQSQIQEYTDQTEALNEQTATISNLEKQVNDIASDNWRLETETITLQSQLKDKDGEIERLRASVNSLKYTNDNLQSAYHAATDVVNNVYKTNVLMPIADMNPGQLETAKSKFEGLKTLLVLDQSLYDDLEAKVNEMALWKALVEPMRNAKQYLKGKYDNKTREELIAAISNVPIKGNKADETKAMLSYLNNQIPIKEHYDIIVRNLDELGCIPNAEQLKEAESMLNRSLEKVETLCQPGVYDSFERGINLIKVELLKPAPSNRMKTPSEFGKFIKELKEIF